MDAVVTVEAGESLWVNLSKRTVITLTRSVHRIEVKTQLPECQLHSTLHAGQRRLIYEISQGVSTSLLGLVINLIITTVRVYELFLFSKWLVLSN